MRRIEYQLAVSLSAWERLGEGIHGFCQRHAVPEEAADSVMLACEEWFVNIVRHGCREAESAEPVSFTLELTSGEAAWPGGPAKPGLLAVFQDGAPPFDPLLHPDPQLDLPVEQRPIGGLGIWLIKQKMDDLIYERSGGHNVFRMFKACRSD